MSTVSNLAAFNSSGNFTGWAPLANGTVKTFATDGSGAIIAGGSFTKIGTAGRPHIAEFLANGTLVDKTTFAATADGDVQALATAGGTLYMGGQFATVDGDIAAVPGRRVAHRRHPRLGLDAVRGRPRGRPGDGGRKRRRGRVLPERRLRGRRPPVGGRVRRHDRRLHQAG